MHSSVSAHCFTKCCGAGARSQAPEPRTSGAAQKSDVSATLFLPPQLQLPQKLEADRTLVSLLAQSQASPEVTVTEIL